jgi:hypothetical protein
VTTLESGGKVGRYQIIRFLGAGAMGEVFLAEDPHIERRLAIKTVRLTGGRPQDIEDRKKRLLREARAAGRLLHPNVVALFDAGEENGLLYLAFEFVEGCDLASRLETGPPPTLREVLRVVRQVADALDYAHRQGIVHRDIKPSNILIDEAGHVKVADFGIAKVAGQNTELTVAGSVMGSPQYLSPEQIRGDELDGRSDIFSLGVVLYELLSGRRPFDGETITTLVYQILHKDPSISELRAVPLRVEQLLHRMLAKDRDERLATAGLVAEELAAIERELPEATLAAAAAPADDALDKTRVLASRSVSALAYADSPAGGPVPPVPPASPGAVTGAPSRPLTGAPHGGATGAPYGEGSTAAIPVTAAGAAPVSAASGLAGSFPASPPGAASGAAAQPFAAASAPPPAVFAASAPMPPRPGVPPPQLQPPAPPPPVARGASGSRLWLVLLAVVAILGIGIVGSAYWLWQRYGPHAGEETVATAAGPSAPASAPGSPSNPASPATAGAPSPGPAGAQGPAGSSGPAGSETSAASAASAASPGAVLSPPPAPPVVVPPAVSSPPHAVSPSPRPGPAPPSQSSGTAALSQTTQGSRPSQPSRTSQPTRTSRTAAEQQVVPPPGADAEPPAYNPNPEAPSRSRATAPPVPASPAVPEGRDAAGASGGAGTAAVSAESADRVLRSGLELAFRVNPPDAYVLLDGGVIGRAEEWSGEKGGRSFTLPGTGPHLIKIKKPGMKDYRITVEASASRGVTAVVVNLQALPSMQVETSDLQTIRVREAVALRLQPEVDAVVQVDGTSVGPAKRYAGRFGHSDEWLSLPPGTHRVTVIAAGYARRDLAVEITPGAEKARQKIDVPMSREAGN